MSASRIYEAEDINTAIEREKEIKNGKEKRKIVTVQLDGVFCRLQLPACAVARHTG